MNVAYLDWNATAPPLPQAVDAMQRAFSDGWGNASSPHAVGRSARRIIEKARDSVASLAGANPRDVVFTSGATESNNFALRSLCCDAARLITSRLEHPSVVRVAEALAQAGLSVVWLGVSDSGLVALEELEHALAASPEPSGCVVALQAANHETGVIQPVAEAIDIAHRYGARVHVDAVQGAGKLNSARWRDADTVALSSHKLGGPQGVGALVARGCGGLRPLILGGEQEQGLRAGTVSAALAVGFGAAADWANAASRDYAPIQALRDELETALLELGGIVNGTAARLPHVTNLSFPGLRGDELVIGLDLEGVCVSAGSACGSGASERSAVIEAMVGEDRAAMSVRASIGWTTSKEEISGAIAAWRLVIARARRMDEVVLEVLR